MYYNIFKIKRSVISICI